MRVEAAGDGGLALQKPCRGDSGVAAAPCHRMTRLGSPCHGGWAGGPGGRHYSVKLIKARATLRVLWGLILCAAIGRMIFTLGARLAR